jgi:hypothetical protein
MFVLIKLSVLLFVLDVGGHVDEAFEAVDEVGDDGDDNEDVDDDEDDEEEDEDDEDGFGKPLVNKTPPPPPPPPSPLPVPFNGRGIVSFDLIASNMSVAK